MSREIKITTVGEHGECELCGKVAELRPYGPNGESICFDCGMKDEATVKKKFTELLVKTDFLVVGGCEKNIVSSEVDSCKTCGFCRCWPKSYR